MSTIGGIDLTGGTIAAFGALLVYDVFCVTFEEEVSLVWPSPWNYGKVIFFLNRYLPFVDTFLSLHLLLGKNTDQECLLGFRAVTWLIVVGIFISELILMMRTYAFWGARRLILIILVTLGLAVFVPAIVAVQIEVSSYAYRADSTGCTKTKASSPIIFVAFLLLIICETTIVILTLIVVRRDHRRTRSPLVQQMYKDGLLYYIYLISFSIVNLLIAVAAPPDFANWLTTPQRVLHSLLCTRVLLHIRAHGTNSDEEVFTTQPTLTFATANGAFAEQVLSDLSSGSDPVTSSGFGTSSGSSGSRARLSFLGQSQSSGSRTREKMEEYGVAEGQRGEVYELQPLSRRATHVKFGAREDGSVGRDETGRVPVVTASRRGRDKGKLREVRSTESAP
ncbi:hypothetical protein M0805_007125 [Coniferiporia weirii]|nr:hypothetical protein M0805_007125 [Coniferiporia weirii]